MKKVLFVIIVLLLPVGVSAQVRYGVEAGVNATHFRHGNTAGQYEASQSGGMKMGFQLGGTVEYTTSKSWVWMSGLSWSQTQSDMNLRMQRFPDTTIKLNSLSIPVKIGYTFRINDGLNVVPYVGIYGSYNFSAGKSTVGISYWEGNTVVNKQDKWDPMDGFAYNFPGNNPDIPEYAVAIQACRHWTYGAVGGVKAVVRNRYVLNLSYQEEIKKIMSQGGLRRYGVQLSVGYLF